MNTDLSSEGGGEAPPLLQDVLLVVILLCYLSSSGSIVHDTVHTTTCTLSFMTFFVVFGGKKPYFIAILLNISCKAREASKGSYSLAHATIWQLLPHVQRRNSHCRKRSVEFQQESEVQLDLIRFRF